MVTMTSQTVYKIVSWSNYCGVLRYKSCLPNVYQYEHDFDEL